MKTFNYTGRKKIERKDIGIETFFENGKICFRLFDLKLEEYDFPKNSKLFLEAYKRTTMMSFSLGTIENPIHVPDNNDLSEFHDPSDILFRIKVIEQDDSALLLGRGEEIRARVEDRNEEGAGTSLLPIMSEDLGEEVWKLDFTDKPVLLINNKLSKGEAHGDIFVSVVLPQAFQQILMYLFFVDQSEYNSDYADDSWQYLWYTFARKLVDDTLPPAPENNNSEEIMEWIGSAVASFSEKNRCRSLYEKREER